MDEKIDVLAKIFDGVDPEEIFGEVSICSSCGMKSISVNNGLCPSCIGAKKAKEKHLEELNNMTLEERIRRIEEILYDLSLKKCRCESCPHGIYYK